MNIESSVFVVLILLVGFLMFVVPRLTRPDLFFAVTVSPDFRRTVEGRRIKQRYQLIVVAATAAAVLIETLARTELAAILVQTGGAALGLIMAHGMTLPHAATVSRTIEIDIAAPAERIPGGAVALLLPPFSLAVLAAWVQFNWHRLPEGFAVHWTLQGADRWVTTTPDSVHRFIGEHIFLCLMLAAGALGIIYWSRRISTMGPRAERERMFRRHAIQLILVVEYFMAAPPWIALTGGSPKLMAVWGAALAIVVFALSLRLIRSGQGGSRSAPSRNAAVGDRTPDASWKLGIIYFNPADPSILVEKRFGIGYTLNLGNLKAWAAIAVMVVIWLLFLR